MTTLAQKFLVLWYSADRSIAARTLATRLDPQVHKTQISIPLTEYRFSDGSSVYTHGHGHYFTPKGTPDDPNSPIPPNPNRP